MREKILLLGSGELGKELVIALQRLGRYIVAVDSYPGAPAMQVAQEFEVIDMLDGDALDQIVQKHQPDLIVPEVEAIRTERLYDYEKQGMTVVPTARAVNFTMNRRAIRDLAAGELGLRTAAYAYATSEAELRQAIFEKGIDLPCVIKPLMSSSGKGQSVIKTKGEIPSAWEYSQQGRTGKSEIIVEEFIDFHTEITLLTLTQKKGPTLFCPALGHRQERGDYQESWQPCDISKEDYQAACEMAEKVTTALGGAGIWGVEFFLTNRGVYFSELSPRPHDTGMTTMVTQNLSEFELHARAILGLPVPEIKLVYTGCSAVVLAGPEVTGAPSPAGASPENIPMISGIEKALANPNIDVRVFGKPTTRPYRRMGVALCRLPVGSDTEEARRQAKAAADLMEVENPGS